MGIQLIDGKGSGKLAEVDSKNRLRGKSVTLPEIHDESSNGNAYSFASGTYNYTGAETILLVKNTGTTELVIVDIWLSVDTDTRAVIHLPITEVTPTGTAITGTNLNTGSANTADATAKQNETNNTQGSIIWSGEIYAINGPVKVEFYGAVALAKNKSIGVDYVTTGGACDVTILAFFE